MSLNTLPVELRVLLARWLTLEDALYWLITALECGDEETATALRLHSGAYPLAHCTAELVRVAALFGCLRAVAALLAPAFYHAIPSEKLREFVALLLPHKLPVWVLHSAIFHCPDDGYVQWLTTQCQRSDDLAHTIHFAAMHKRLALFQWLADHFASTSRHDPSSVRVLAPVEDGVDYACCVVMVRLPMEDDAMIVRSLFADAVNGDARELSFRLHPGQAPPLYPAMDHAAEIGDLRLLQRLHEDSRVDWPCTTRAMDAAATNGRLDIIQWLHINRQEGCSHDAMDGAARNGHFEVAKWLYYFRQERGSARAYDLAAAGGHLRILRWQRTRFVGFKLSTSALEQAARGGFLETLRWVDETYARVEITALMVQNAVNGGHLQLLQWLMDKLRAEYKSPRAFLQSHFISEGATRGNLALLQWLWLEFALVPHHALHHALISGCMEVVHWLLGVIPAEEQGIRSGTLWRVAAKGQWTVLEWLLETQPQLCGRCVFLSAGQLARVQYNPGVTPWLTQYTRLMLRYAPQRCLNEPLLPLWAARHSLVDILDQLLTLGHPFVLSKRVLHTLLGSSASLTASKVVKAIVAQHPDRISTRVVQWAASYGFTGLLTAMVNEDSAVPVVVLRSTLFTACRRDRADVVEWANRHTSHQTNRTVGLWRGCAQVAARHDSLRVLQWLDDHNCIQEPLADVLSVTVRCGSIRVAKWLLQRMVVASLPIEIDTRDVLKALGRGHVAIVEWLHHELSRNTITASARAFPDEMDGFLRRWLRTRS